LWQALLVLLNFRLPLLVLLFSVETSCLPALANSCCCCCSRGVATRAAVVRWVMLLLLLLLLMLLLFRPGGRLFADWQDWRACWYCMMYLMCLLVLRRFDGVLVGVEMC
jgi:hypothetical protein